MTALIQDVVAPSTGRSDGLGKSQGRGLTKQTLKIEIVSDAICPWCYVAGRRLNDPKDRRDSWEKSKKVAKTNLKRSSTSVISAPDACHHRRQMDPDHPILSIGPCPPVQRDAAADPRHFQEDADSGGSIA